MKLLKKFIKEFRDVQNTWNDCFSKALFCCDDNCNKLRESDSAEKDRREVD